MGEIRIPELDEALRLIRECHAKIDKKIAEASRPEWLSMSEACERLDVHTATIHRMVQDGRIDSKGIGKTRRFLILPQAIKEAPDMVPPASPALRTAIIQRDGDVCAYCGEVAEIIHIDHIVPRTRGGTNNPENLTVACATCNISKGNKLLEEWLGRKQ